MVAKGSHSGLVASWRHVWKATGNLQGSSRVCQAFCGVVVGPRIWTRARAKRRAYCLVVVDRVHKSAFHL